MGKVKVYLDEARKGFAVCPKCGTPKQIEFDDSENVRSHVVKCTCGNTFSVILEKRKNYRKKVNLFGKCFAAADTAEGAVIKLINISRGGLRFIKMDGRPLELHEIIRISLSLGKDTIDCVASVDNILNESIGAKFINLDEHRKKVLGFFLLP